MSVPRGRRAGANCDAYVVRLTARRNGLIKRQRARAPIWRGLCERLVGAATRNSRRADRGGARSYSLFMLLLVAAGRVREVSPTTTYQGFMVGVKPNGAISRNARIMRSVTVHVWELNTELILSGRG